MKRFKSYLPFILVILIIIIFKEPRYHVMNYAWIGVVALIIGIILIFEFIESSRIKRIKKWKSGIPGKYMHIIKFSLFLGVPISSIIIFIILDNSEFYYSIIIILIPLLILFGWFGFLDWKKCYKIYYDEKYNSILKK